jgi:copper oxidase (laccase) domain-containing protein
MEGQMEEEPITAFIGPAARGCCYEVGEEVHSQFEEFDARRGERNLDLAAVIQTQLKTSAAVRSIFDLELCTMCDPERLFFSHRREGGVTGRHAGLVWRTGKHDDVI